MSIERIPIEGSSEVVTVDETLGKRELATFSKSIVRLKPSAVAEASDVKQVADDLRKTALAMKLLPRPPANRLVLSAQGNNVVTEMPTDTRAFALAAIDQNNHELREYVSELCDKEQL